MTQQLRYDPDALIGFCRRYHIRKLAMLGAAHGDPDAERDVLAHFELGHQPGKFQIVEMAFELSELFHRKVAIRTPENMSRAYLQKAQDTAEVIFQAPS